MEHRPSPPISLRHLRIALLEDSDIDAELLVSHLEAGGFSFEVDRAVSRDQFRKALGRHPDIVLADYSLPDFDGLSALAMTRDLAPDIPFIFVSGVVGEEFATNALQRGAVDYVTKRNLRRLPAAVARAAVEASERQGLRRAEEALRASEIASRLALTASNIGSWDFNPREGKVQWDGRCRELMAVPPEVQINAESAFKTVHPEDVRRIRQAFDAAQRAGHPGQFREQFRVLAADGTTRWLEGQGQSLFEGEECIRFIGILRDITREKEAEAELLARTATLQADVEEQARVRDLLWRNSQDLLVVIGSDGVIQAANPSWQRILDRKPAEVIGRNVLEVTFADDHAATLEALQQTRHQTLSGFNIRLLHRDGTHRWFSWTAAPDESGVIYANGRNITAEREAQERLEQTEEALRQAQKMEAIGQLTGGIAHDFNNLLAGIVGSLDILQRRLSSGRSEDTSRFIEAAMNSAHKAAALTHRLLAFSRRQSLDAKPVDANATVRAMGDLLKRTLGENIHLQSDCSPGLWLALCDENQTESAILNLAINARDAMPDGGTLRIATENREVDAAHARERAGLTPGQYVVISVSDTGIGMPREVLAKVFDPFFTTKPIGQGTGLGLSMIYGFVKQSGGHVQIDSTPGEGTTIELLLPRFDGVVAGKTEQHRSEAPRAADGECVLVVEDDPGVRMLILEVLQELGYESLAAVDAGSAMPILEGDGRIDLLISDVGLPGLSGRQLAEVARQKRPDLPVLFVTGYAEGAEARSGFLAQGMEMVTKPFPMDMLATKIRSMLGTPG